MIHYRTRGAGRLTLLYSPIWRHQSRDLGAPHSGVVRSHVAWLCHVGAPVNSEKQVKFFARKCESVFPLHKVLWIHHASSCRSCRVSRQLLQLPKTWCMATSGSQLQVLNEDVWYPVAGWVDNSPKTARTSGQLDYYGLRKELSLNQKNKGAAIEKPLFVVQGCLEMNTTCTTTPLVFSSLQCAD